MVMSPDGRTLYVAAASSGAIDVFARDPATGALTQTGCWMAEAPPGPCTGVTGLGGVSDLGLSPDGASLYAVGARDSTLVTFATTSGGGLRALGCLEDRDQAESRSFDDGGPSPLDACPKVPGLLVPTGVAITPDGRTVFAAASESGALTTYARDPVTGVLTPAGCIEQRADFPDEFADTEGCTQGSGLEGAADVAVAPGGGGVYVASATSSAVSAFAASAAVASSVARRAGTSLALRIACPAVRGSACVGVAGVNGAARVRRSARAARLLGGGARLRIRPGHAATVRVRLSRAGMRAVRRRPRMALLAVTRDLSARTAPLTRRVVVRRGARR
jgi:DNA-binding beta-propeller fold protein YncE